MNIFRLSIFVFVLLNTWIPAAENSQQVWIEGYTRSDGTQVSGHWRTVADDNKFNNYTTKGNTNPHTGQKGRDVPEGTIWISGYTRKDGTYVKGHFRTRADSNPFNNWGTKGNTNPHTGEAGSYVPRNVIWVEGYTRKDGVEVKGHFRRRPNSSRRDNRNTQGTNGSSASKDSWVQFMQNHEDIVLTELARYNNEKGMSLEYTEKSINRLIRSGALPECLSGLYKESLGNIICVSKAELGPKADKRTQLFEELYADQPE